MKRQSVVRGRVWKFGNNISTTDITPYELFGHGRELTPRSYAFATIRPDWKDKVRPGDCIVAGDNFGFGSHRAVAVEVMKDVRIGCIAANSIARTYLRTAIALGFPAFPCPRVSEIFNEGEELELDICGGFVRNLTTGRRVESEGYPLELLRILEAGGMMPLLIEEIRKRIIENAGLSLCRLSRPTR